MSSTQRNNAHHSGTARTFAVPCLAFAAGLVLCGPSAIAIAGPTLPESAQNATRTHAQTSAPRQVLVASHRLRFAHLLPTAPPALASIDLGDAPSLGGSRLLSRADIHKLVSDASPGTVVPDVHAPIRVVRDSVSLSTLELSELVAKQLSVRGLRRGVLLQRVSPRATLKVPAGWDAVRVEVPSTPRRTGNYSTSAMLTFTEQDHVVLRASVPIELLLTEASMVPDVSKGSRLTIIVRKGLIEIAAGGTAVEDGDVGAIVRATLRGTGKSVRVRLTGPSEGELLGD